MIWSDIVVKKSFVKLSALRVAKGMILIMNNYYAGIGSRKIPQDIADIMEELGFCLSRKGFILRSGASPGSDTAFELGTIRAEGKFDIYLPWKGFGKREGDGYHNAENLPNYRKAKSLAVKYHPKFKRLSEESKKLIIRDTYQILGYDLGTPCRFVICWTEDACVSDALRTEKTGGTGQAISIASDLMIPIYNIRIESHKEKVVNWIKSCY
ncbi:MAG: hypothetical protein ACOCQW_04695 [Halanaerobiaceae bacterium]